MLNLRLDEADARDLAFALRVAIDSGHLVDTYARVVELRGRIMSLVYDQAEQHYYVEAPGWEEASAEERGAATRAATSMLPERAPIDAVEMLRGEAS